MLKICMDSKVQIKIELFKLMKSLMMACIPQMVIDVLLPLAAEHKNAKMREDVVNFVIFALLTFPSREFDLPEITSSIVPCLLDTKRRVRQAGMECTAIIHQVCVNMNKQGWCFILSHFEIIPAFGPSTNLGAL